MYIINFTRKSRGTSLNIMKCIERYNHKQRDHLNGPIHLHNNKDKMCTVYFPNSFEKP